MLIRGTSYGQTGTWQKLTVEQAALLVARQVPMLRSQLGTDVSDREAYVDLIVLNAYGGSGGTDVWIDDLEIAGQVSTGVAPHRTDAPAPEDGTETQTVSSAPGMVVQAGATDSTPALSDPSRLVRAIDYHGESLPGSSRLVSMRFACPRLPTRSSCRKRK